MMAITADAPFRPFALKRPCGNCPFWSDGTPFLDRERARDIADSLHADASFHCHKTLQYGSEDGTGEVTEDSKHCAGALITMEREGHANQMMRIGERLGFYDPSAMAMDSPVHDSLAERVATHDLR
ncbi:hypothetical protein [Pseudarthrobacter sp. H2]|uniref:hypothetical protein n=1 Tax=Pseudarthrobacter sp. H2 TaxID=3418415 RepID=UPI003CE6816F